MSSLDIQIGDTWTDRQHRGRGIARFALQEILKKFEAPGRQFWYVVADSNIASIKVAEAAAMTAVGKGAWITSGKLRGRTLVIRERVSLQ